MSGRRWRHIDRVKPEPGAAEAAGEFHASQATDPPVAAAHPTTAPPSRELAQARALYALGELERCVAALEPLAAGRPPVPGANRLLGLALGRLGPIEGALQPLNRALDESPEDPQLAASLLSAQLLAGRLPHPPPAPAAGPLSEMAGAVYWLLGQSALRKGRPDVAARDFQLAGVLLGSGAPAVLRAQRASAAYFGEAVSRLAAGQLEAAQQCYLRLPDRNRLPAETAAFARQLYEVADALREIDPADQAEALQPLVDLIGAARLRLHFFDQERPVEIWWDHLP